MKASEAYKILEEIRAICKKHGIWISYRIDEKPDLSVIKIEGITIKIGK